MKDGAEARRQNPLPPASATGASGSQRGLSGGGDLPDWVQHLVHRPWLGHREGPVTLGHASGPPAGLQQTTTLEDPVASGPGGSVVAPAAVPRASTPALCPELVRLLSKQDPPISFLQLILMDLGLPGCHNPSCTGGGMAQPAACAAADRASQLPPAATAAAGGGSGGLLRCRGCLRACYCSEACAREAWAAGHRGLCTILRVR